MTKSNTQLAQQRLRGLIFDGVLAPGTDHLETELADRLGLSRTPVREALVALEAQGLVDIRPRKGVRIRPISPSDMDEIYDILTELEALAAANAARQGYKVADLAVLSGAIDDMDTALAHADRISWAEGDARFHQELMHLGGNQRAQSIVAMMEDQVRRARLITLHLRPDPKGSNLDHRAVFMAIATGQADEARRIHHAHRQTAKRVLLDLLRDFQMRQI